MFRNALTFFKTFKHGVAFLVLLLSIFWIKSLLNEPNYTSFIAFQERFSQQERVLQREINSIQASDYRTKKLSKGMLLHVYENDSLIFWSCNQLPAGRYTDLHFPNNGLNKLQNAWYYTQTKRVGNLLIAISFGVQHAYPYENQYLNNRLFPPFNDLPVVLQPDRLTHHIHNLKGENLVGINSTDELPNNARFENSLFGIALLLIFICWHFLYTLCKSPKHFLLLAVITILARIFSIYFPPFEWMRDSEWSDAGIFAIEWIPNLLELTLWIVTAVLVSFSLIKASVFGIPKWLWITLTVILLPTLGLFFPLMAVVIIENSNIPMAITKLMSLNTNSFLLLLFFGIGAWLLLIIYQRLLRKSNAILGFKLTALILLGLNVLLFFVGSIYLHEEKWMLAWPILLAWTLLLLEKYNKGNWNFAAVLFIILQFSVAATFHLGELSEKKEHQIREVYAKNLANEEDINTEVEYLTLKDNILKDNYTERFFDSVPPRFREVKEAFERRFFTDYWERYDIDCFFFHPDDSLTVENNWSQSKINELINNHSRKSEVDSTIFYINDFNAPYVYVFQIPIVKNNQTVLLYGCLKSKRIPEEIGFPRLLISSNTNVFEALSDYSIGKYYQGKLAKTVGSINYPTWIKQLAPTHRAPIVWVTEGDISHLVYFKSKTDALVLSKEDIRGLDLLTAIAFLVIGYGLLFLLVRFVFWRSSNVSLELGTLATRIQLVMIGLVLASLVGFSIASGTFVQQQYDEYSTDLIREKLRSVVEETRHEESFNYDSFLGKDNNPLQDELIDWAKIYQADLNFYLPSGFLFASSRPKLFNIGLVQATIHPKARRKLEREGWSESIQEEKIGDLNYLSAYSPIYSRKNNQLLGYINVQQFAEKSLFENQLQNFFITILNVFMLLLVISIVGAVFVSSWITAPLRMIRKSFSNVAFGKRNARISYASKDELGALVAEYNQKLEELEQTANKLAQSERENAWKEMAKQVAHEIKNPLTPMKLSIQHLQRIFDPNDPLAEQKVQKVCSSLIEQIDALTTIANAFSNFAKMPQPVMQTVDVVALLSNTIRLYQNESNVSIEFHASEDHFDVSADREMLLRVFNNIITNGIQAVAIDKPAQIKIELHVDLDGVNIRFQDNGQGIAEEQLEAIFQPYFTTKSTGTGLGLAMVKQIIESHNGSIGVQQTGPEGTIILLRLPKTSD